MNAVMERRLALLILAGVDFTADDLTVDGVVTIDPAHEANASQNGIGYVFAAASRAGHIAFTGRVIRSHAPHRKGGAIRVWRATPEGRSWAESKIRPL